MSDIERILSGARARKLHVAVAESCTGGMLAAALTAQPGSSDVFDCGYVTYSNAAKMRMLGVGETSLREFGAVSEQVAGEMARGALQGSGADLALSITGIAGPGGSDNKPEGRVCFALAQKGSATITQTCEFGDPGRQTVRDLARDHALHMLLDALESTPV